MLVVNDPVSTEEPAEPEALALPAVGSVIDERYRITRSIGAGGMGAVFEAEHLAVGRRCALKFLRIELVSRSRSAARFRREARLLGRLEHEHLTAVVDYGTYLGTSPYLVMEYLEGHTLKRVFEEQAPMRLDSALEILLQAARGMAYVHGQQVVHRDLKPANLMLIARSDGRPWLKILDFGIARALMEIDDKLTPSGAELGTAHYMSPEQARGTKQVDPRSDVYALGTILYEALTGAHVHPGDSYNAVIFHLLTQPHRPLKEVLPACPDAVHDVVERCLERDPQRRYVDAGALADDLARLPRQTRDAPDVYGSAGRARVGFGGLSHRRGIWLVAGTALGSVVTAGIGASMLGDRAPGVRRNAESAPTVSVENVQKRSEGAALVVPDATPEPSARVLLPTPGEGVRQPRNGMERPAQLGSSARARDFGAPAADPRARPSRAAERVTLGPEVGALSVATPLAPPGAMGNDSIPSVGTGGAGPAAPGLDVDSTPPNESFPFVTSNPYEAN